MLFRTNIRASYALVRTSIYSLSVAIFHEKAWNDNDKKEILQNWSGTHQCAAEILRPTTIQEAEQIILEFNKKKQKIRCVGSGISPNGIGFSDSGYLLNMGFCDRILNINEEKQQVTVESGVVIGDLLKDLKKHGLTLQNLASIKEQQVGGWIQTGCHGTGATLPPVDDQVIELELLTPGKGLITLNKERNQEHFYLAKCGLGALGVVAKVTLQCVPRHLLVEETFVLSLKELRTMNASLLKKYLHVRYMWIPYTDSIVVVGCNPIAGEAAKEITSKKVTNDISPLKKLYLEKLQEKQIDCKSAAELEMMNFADYRDKLLALDPLNSQHVAQVNKAESEYWKLNQGIRIGYSDEILGFECGGQQFVLEAAFPCGLKINDDIEIVQNLLQSISENNIPAPAPIEQRWSLGSTSVMNPASNRRHNGKYSWIGIIMYLDNQNQNSITLAFQKYSQIFQQFINKNAGGEHWAKLEYSHSDVESLRKRLSKLYPVDRFQSMRKEMDPNNILANDFIDALFS